MDSFAKITHNAANVAKQLDLAASKQIPFATALALTRSAQRIQQNEKTVMRSRLDRPTPFTMNSLFVKSATKTRLEARVWFKDYAAKGSTAGQYLQPQVMGGQRRQKRFERALVARGYMKSSQYVVPAKSAPTDAYGNVPRSVYVKILSALGAFAQQGYLANATGSKRSKAKGNADKYFYANLDGTEGIWERVRSAFGTGAKPIFIFTESAPQYRARFPFFKIAETTHQAHYVEEFERALDYALKSAK
jgi:hypothetical protein